MSLDGFPAALKYFHSPSTAPAQAHEADICIYGANSAGIAAAIQVRRMGKSCVLLEFGRHLGGLTSGGLGATDIGNKMAIGGISREFYRRLGKHYGNAENWTFEPHVAEDLYREMLAEAGVTVHFEHQLDKVRMADGRITEISFLNGSTCRA